MPFKNDTKMILKGYVDEIPHILLFFYNKSRKNETGGSEMYPTYMPQYPQRQQEYRPMMPMMTQPVIPQSNGFNCLPVTSKAEAEVFQIPFDGTTTYFVDTANGKIYAKTFNATTGAAPLVTFSRDAEVVAATPEYVTKETVDEMKQTINRLAEDLNTLKKGKVKKDDAE